MVSVVSLHCSSYTFPRTTFWSPLSMKFTRWWRCNRGKSNSILYGCYWGYTIIFMWDNGTPGQVAQSPYGRRTVKWSLHQWGINVPLVVSGYWVTRQWEREDALVNTTDMFATVSDIANTWTTSINNSISFKDALTTNAFDEI